MQIRHFNVNSANDWQPQKLTHQAPHCGINSKASSQQLQKPNFEQFDRKLG